MVTVDQPDHLAHLVKLAHLDHWGQPETKAQQVHLDPKEIQELLVSPELKDPLVAPDHLVSLEMQAVQDQLVLQVRRDSLDRLEELEAPDNQGQLERLEQVDKLDHWEILDLLDLLDSLVVLDLKDL